MILSDVGDDTDGRPNDPFLAHPLVARVDRHTLHHDGVDEGGHPVPYHLDLLQDGRRSCPLDRMVLPVGSYHRGEGARRFANCDHARFPQHARDEPGDGGFAPDTIDVDAVRDHGDALAVPTRLTEQPKQHADRRRDGDDEEDELCRHRMDLLRLYREEIGPNLMILSTQIGKSRPQGLVFAP